MVSNAINELAFNLLGAMSRDQREASGEPSNIFFSPVSVSSCLSILLLGSDDETQRQLFSGSSFGRFFEEPNQVHGHFEQLLDKYLKTETDQEEEDNISRHSLAIGSRLLIRQDLTQPVTENFKNSVIANYKAAVDEVDFAKKGEEIKLWANNWVDEATNGMIRTILEKRPDAATNLLLLNAVYFKGKWVLPFNSEMTSKLKFYNWGRSTDCVDIEMMTLFQVYLNYRSTQVSGEEVEIIEIPYFGNFSMFVLLPKKREGMLSFDGLNYAELEKEFSSATLEPVDIYLPKFKTETQCSLNEPLKSLGIRAPFDEMAADFTKIREERGVFISQFLHKAALDVNEEGTEASAVTGVDVPEGYSEKVATKSFRVDHPFLFFIRDNENRLILFMGKINQL